jgi:hypothetical protein
VLVERLELGKSLVPLPHPQIEPEPVKLKAHPAECPGQAWYSESPYTRHGDCSGRDEAEHDEQGEGEGDEDERCWAEGSEGGKGVGGIGGAHAFDG